MPQVEQTDRRWTGRTPIFFLLGAAVLSCSILSVPDAAAGGEASLPAAAPAVTRELAYNEPGQYVFRDKCFQTIDMTIVGGGPSDPVPEFRSAELWVCVVGVSVNDDRTLRFDVEYMLKPTDPDAGPVVRKSDRGNRNVYLTDDRGGRYEVETAGGCAAKDLQAEREAQTCLGWFLFPAPDPDAHSFVFHYAPANRTEGFDEIAGIELTDPE
jgi:hypothetical protein